MVELKKGGKDIPLTNDNRQGAHAFCLTLNRFKPFKPFVFLEEYVDLYVDYILCKSISKQLNVGYACLLVPRVPFISFCCYLQSFRQGFSSVCGGEALKLFRHEELELLICGSSELDFEALEQVCSILSYAVTF